MAPNGIIVKTKDHRGDYPFYTSPPEDVLALRKLNVVGPRVLGSMSFLLKPAACKDIYISTENGFVHGKRNERREPDRQRFGGSGDDERDPEPEQTHPVHDEVQAHAVELVRHRQQQEHLGELRQRGVRTPGQQPIGVGRQRWTHQTQEFSRRQHGSQDALHNFELGPAP